MQLYSHKTNKNNTPVAHFVARQVHVQKMCEARHISVRLEFSLFGLPAFLQNTNVPN